MNTISIKLPEAMKRQLEIEASQRGISRSQLIRKSLERSLGMSKKVAAPSCCDLMIGACGVITDAPLDLSSNKKHMKGYGK